MIITKENFHCETKDLNGNYCPERPIHLIDIGDDEQVLLCHECAFNFLMKEHLDRLKDF
jgi:hypothetical protein